MEAVGILEEGLKVQLVVVWVAVKELKLSYNNGYVLIWVPQYSNLS